MQRRADDDTLPICLLLHDCHALLHEIIEADAHKGEFELSGLDFGEIEQIVDKRNKMPARGVYVLEILPVAFAADRAKALVHHHFGKSYDGIERCTNLMADLGKKLGLRRGCLLGCASGIDQFFLDALPGGDVAQYCAKFFTAFDASDRDMQRNKTALAHTADCFVAGAE